jgi:hypothetical protein
MILLFDNIGNGSSDVVTSFFNFAWNIAYTKMLSQAWFYGFLIALVLFYIVGSFLARNGEWQHSRF